MTFSYEDSVKSWSNYCEFVEPSSKRGTVIGEKPPSAQRAILHPVIATLVYSA